MVADVEENGEARMIWLVEATDLAEEERAEGGGPIWVAEKGELADLTIRQQWLRTNDDDG